MVVVLPAGAHIPAPPPKDFRKLGAAKCVTNGGGGGAVDSIFRQGVAHFVTSLDPHSACSVPMVTISLESVLPRHLKQRPTPREVGLVKFTLQQGIVDKLHAYLDPGTLPRGFMHEAQFHSDTHKIPVLDFSEPTQPCVTVYNNILTFIHPYNCVFAREHSVPYIEEGLNCIREKAGNRTRVQVLPLETLALELTLIACQEVSYTSGIIADELRPQILEHITHFGCDYHASRDIPVCALSNSSRQAIATHYYLQSFFSHYLCSSVTPQTSDTKEFASNDTSQTVLARTLSMSRDPTPYQSAGGDRCLDQSGNRLQQIEQSAGGDRCLDQSGNRLQQIEQSAGRERCLDQSGNRLQQIEQSANVGHRTSQSESSQLSTLYSVDFALPEMFQGSVRIENCTDSTQSPLTCPRKQCAVNQVVERGYHDNRQSSRDNGPSHPAEQLTSPVTSSTAGTRRIGLGRGFLREALLPRRPKSSSRRGPMQE